MIKRYVTLVIFFVCMSILLVSCKSAKPKNVDLSGDYTIEELLELIQPARDAMEEIDQKSDYATDEEKVDAKNQAYNKALSDLGFKGGEVMVVNGVLNGSFPVDKGETIMLSLTDNDRSCYLSILGTAEDLGWVCLIEPDTNVKVQFTVTASENEDGTVSYRYQEGKVMSPSKITAEKRDCHVYSTDDKAVAIGRVKNLYTFTYTQKELDDLENEIGFFSWASAIRRCTHFAILEDNMGYEVGAFINADSLPKDIMMTDIVGVRGSVYETPDIGNPDLPSLYIDSTLSESAYIFPIE